MDSYMWRMDKRLHHWHRKLYELSELEGLSDYEVNQPAFRELTRKFRLARESYAVVQDAGEKRRGSGRDALDSLVRDFEDSFADSMSGQKSQGDRDAKGLVSRGLMQ
jgi:hypothetical protein